MTGTTTAAGSPRRTRALVAGWLPAAVALVAVHVALVLPDRADLITPAAFLLVPAETAVVLVLSALPGRMGTMGRAIAAVFLTLALAVKLADMASFAAYARPFNPVLDFALLGAAMNLLSGAIGPAGAVAAAVGATLAVVTLAGLAFAAMATIGRWAVSRRRSIAVAGAALGMAWVGLGATGSPVATASSSRILVEHGTVALASLGDRAAFEAEAAVDPFRDVPGDRLLAGLRGKDVLVVFLESYGRTVLDRAEYAEAIRPVLEKGSEALAKAGLGVRSAWLTSPTVGGMSWLAHGTLLSGLRVDNQGRYDALVTGERASLNGLFRRAGWRTVAVMPAITMAWPESRWFGYDAIHAAADLGYAGKPFNWVTMPDQYTLSAFERLERARADRPPVMAEMALISSHAPWTPVPRLVDWSMVGDGRIFDRQATAGDPPEVVWRDPARVRRQYRDSIAYVLETLVSYALTYGDDRLVILALGDHQPAPLVTGPKAGREVPVHLIARDPAVIERVAGWGWMPGLVPAPGAPVWGMEAVRERLLSTFSRPDAAVRRPPTAGLPGSTVVR